MNSAVASPSLGSSTGAPSAAGSSLTAGWPRWALRLWRALEASGHARAQRHLREFADQCEASQPELAKELRAACRAAGAA